MSGFSPATATTARRPIRRPRCRPRHRRARESLLRASCARGSRARRAGRRRRRRPRPGTSPPTLASLAAQAAAEQQAADERVAVAHRPQQEARGRTAVLGVAPQAVRGFGSDQERQPDANRIEPTTTAIPFIRAPCDSPAVANDTGGHSRRRQTHGHGNEDRSRNPRIAARVTTPRPLLGAHLHDGRQGAPPPSRPRLRRPGLGTERPPDPRAAQPRDALRERPPRRHRLPLDPAGRPGHRALGGRVVRAEPRVLRSARTSSSSPSKAAATRWPPRSACSARSRARRRTRSRSSSRSTTTSCSPTRTTSTR